MTRFDSPRRTFAAPAPRACGDDPMPAASACRCAYSAPRLRGSLVWFGLVWLAAAAEGVLVGLLLLPSWSRVVARSAGFSHVG
mgnify:CR=1 FL=1|jgi:hypothetical protein